MSDLTFEDLNRAFSYCPATGLITRKAYQTADGRSNSRDAGKVIGTTMKEGYITVRLRQKIIYVHRVAWVLMTGTWPEALIDHINGNRSDNRWTNLRAATHSENQQNRRRHRNNATGYKGVTRSDKKFAATICLDRKVKWLGRFDTPEEAHDAYMKAAREHFGEFARAA